MKTIKITKHSLYDAGVVSKTENISNIIDKMIRLTAKLTEYYASDITYDINSLNDAVENGNEFDRLLFFREMGVETRITKGFNIDSYESLLLCCTPIQVWRLTHDPSITETKLIRVDINT